MPVSKFRSVTEMEENTWRQPGDPNLYRAIRGTWEFAQRTLDPRFPPGVHKHRSIEDADKQRQQWEDANFAAYRARMSSSR